MNNYEDEYECEECGGSFIIKPELDEDVEYCPQCGSNTAFCKIHNILEERLGAYLYEN